MRSSLENFCRQTDILDWQTVQTYLQAGKGSKCWYLLNLAMWWQQYIAEESSGTSATAPLIKAA